MHIYTKGSQPQEADYTLYKYSYWYWITVILKGNNFALMAKNSGHFSVSSNLHNYIIVTSMVSQLFKSWMLIFLPYGSILHFCLNKDRAFNSQDADYKHWLQSSTLLQNRGKACSPILCLEM